MNKRTIIIILLAISTLVGIFGYVYFCKNYFLKVVMSSSPEVGYDFGHYYTASRIYFDNPSQIYKKSFEINVPQFIYPPPSIVLFLPFSLGSFKFGYAAFVLFGVLCQVLNAWIFIKILRFYKFSIGKIEGSFIYVFFLSTAPFLQNFKAGQINSVVLCLTLLFLYFYLNKKYVISIIFLFMGIWLKLYPILLLPIIFKNGYYKEKAIGIALGLFGIPVILLPFIPLHLYKIYFIDLLPLFSNQLIIGSFNQSFASLVMRIGMPVQVHSSWDYLSIPVNIRILNYFFTVIVLGYVYFKMFKIKNYPEILAFCLISAVSVIISPVGWEYVFILTIPLIVLSLLSKEKFNNFESWLIVLIVLLFLIPKLPDGVINSMYAHFPKIFILLFFSRFLRSILYFVFIYDRKTNREKLISF